MRDSQLLKPCLTLGSQIKGIIDSVVANTRYCNKVLELGVGKCEVKNGVC